MARKKVKILALLLVIFAAFGYYFWQNVVYGKRDIENEKVYKYATWEEILKDFRENESLANKKYLEKVIEISGKATLLDGQKVVVDDYLVCQFEKKTTIKISEKIVFKGRLVGYDDLLGEVHLVNCFLVKR